MSVPEIAVNLLWCVPGQVGGSEEYLVRQLLGLAGLAGGEGAGGEGAGDAAPEWALRLYALDGFAAAHPELAALARIETAPFAGRRRPQRIAGEATWLRRAAPTASRCATTAAGPHPSAPPRRTS